MQLAQLLKDFDVAAVPSLDIAAITSDSREAQAGSLFIALAGFGGLHGLHFAEQAVQGGAVAVLWEPAENAPELPTLNCAVILAVPDLQQRLSIIAARFYGEPSKHLSVVGITGTDGKTSCAWLLVQAWQWLASRAAMIGTLGKGEIGGLRRGSFTTPFPIELQSELAGFAEGGIERVAMEVSSHALEQRRVGDVAFDVAVLTNLGRDHLDYHQTLEAYAEAKASLFKEYQPRVAVLNIDDHFGQRLMSEVSTEVLTYGLSDSAQLRASNITLKNGMSFELSYGAEQIVVKTQLLGRFNVYNLLAVAAVLLSEGYEFDAAAEALANIKAPPGRLETFVSGETNVVVDYAHTADALAAALSGLREVASGRLMCVFGCGGDRDSGKRALMAQAAESGADQVWVTDDNPRSEDPAAIFADIREGFTAPDSVRWNHDRAAAIADAIETMSAGDVLLVAGKGHEDYQLIAGERRRFSDREQVAAKLGLPAPEVLYA